MTLSPIQALLARTLLQRSQKEVAKAIGFSNGALSQFETGVSDPPASRVQQLQTYYEEAGVEFIEGNGVRERRNYVQHYHDVAGFRAFMDDVYETARAHGGDICLFNTQPAHWHRHLGKDWYDMHNRRMTALGDAIHIRIVLREGDQSYILSCAHYRWIPEGAWRESMYYAYGPKLALLSFAGERIHIMVFNQAELADSFRVLYDIAWAHITIPAVGHEAS